jgi:hypothetical protein
MNALLALFLALAPQEDDSKRARDAAFGLPGLHVAAPQAPAPDPAPPASFMTPRVKRTPEDYKALLDHNVFSPPRKKEAPKTEKKDGPPPAPEPKVRTWVVTGIVFNSIDKRYEALIEDPAAPKESKFFKTGDSLAGVTISNVTFDQVEYKRGETPGVLKLNDKLTETVAGAPANGAAPAKVEDQGEVEKARERMKKRNKRESVPDEAEEDAEIKKKPK